jgi:hypothetical protein
VDCFLFVAALFRITYTDAAAYVANKKCMDILDIRNLGFVDYSAFLTQHTYINVRFRISFLKLFDIHVYDSRYNEKLPTPQFDINIDITTVLRLIFL